MIFSSAQIEDGNLDSALLKSEKLTWESSWEDLTVVLEIPAEGCTILAVCIGQ